MSAVPAGRKSVGPWLRAETTIVDDALHPISVEVTQYLDMDAAVERLDEALRWRGDASLRDVLDHALNGQLGDLTPDEPDG